MADSIACPTTVIVITYPHSTTHFWSRTNGRLTEPERDALKRFLTQTDTQLEDRVDESLSRLQTAAEVIKSYLYVCEVYSNEEVFTAEVETVNLIRSQRDKLTGFLAEMEKN
jgi:guanylate kinase